jgi:transposase
VPDRNGLEGIVFVLRSGARWRDVPAAFGSGSTCWRRFVAWTAAGVWGRCHRALLAALGRRGLINLNRAVIDSASVRAVKGGRTPAPTRPTGAKTAANATR